MITTTYNSPLGNIVLAANERGLCGLWFEDQRYACSLLNGSEPNFDMYTGVLSGLPEAEHVEGFDEVSGANPMSASDPRNMAAVGVLERTWAWLNAYFAGQAPRWVPPLAFEGTEFQHAVWVALLEVPYGTTVSYGELARMVAARLGFAEGAAASDPSTAGVFASPRAVANAVAHNPISIIVPCHRIIAADGSLAGYAGGIDRKRKLLALEGAL